MLEGGGKPQHKAGDDSKTWKLNNTTENKGSKNKRSKEYILGINYESQQKKPFQLVIL